MARGFVDIHCHLIYGIDDGPRTLKESAAMLGAAYGNGTRAVIATSHMFPGVREFQEFLYYQRVDELREYCKTREMDLTILTGAEVFYTELTTRFLSERRIPTLGESDYVLVEFHPSVKYDEICNAVVGIRRVGYHPVLAHVERYGCLINFPRRMEELRKRYSAVLQMNCSSVLGGKGWLRDRQARRALEEELIDVVASDAHNNSSRAPRMQEAYAYLEEKFDREYAESLTGMSWDLGANENLTRHTPDMGSADGI